MLRARLAAKIRDYGSKFGRNERPENELVRLPRLCSRGSVPGTRVWKISNYVCPMRGASAELRSARGAAYLKQNVPARLQSANPHALQSAGWSQQIPRTTTLTTRPFSVAISIKQASDENIDTPSGDRAS